MARWREKEFLNLMMDLNMTDSTKTIKSMVQADILHKMGKFMMDYGKMESGMERVI